MPKTFLAIETSTRQMGVALLDEQGVRSAYELLADYPHAVELPDAVRRVLKAGGSTLEQVEAVIIDIGPGSFTGLRIGLAFAKALAFPARKPLVGVASLDLLAAGLAFSPRLICPILDARQGNVYAALYRAEAGAATRQAEYWLGPVDEILARCPQPQFAAQDLWWPRAATLGRLGRDRFFAGQRDDPAKLLPLYLYPLDCSVRGPDRPTSVLPTKIVQAA